MEFLLLWADELDDAMGTVRHLAPRALGLIMACIAFAAALIALMLAPHLALAICALVLSTALVAFVRGRRAAVAPDLRK